MRFPKLGVLGLGLLLSGCSVIGKSYSPKYVRLENELISNDSYIDYDEVKAEKARKLAEYILTVDKTGITEMKIEMGNPSLDLAEQIKKVALDFEGKRFFAYVFNYDQSKRPEKNDILIIGASTNQLTLNGLEIVGISLVDDGLNGTCFSASFLGKNNETYSYERYSDGLESTRYFLDATYNNTIDKILAFYER